MLLSLEPHQWTHGCCCVGIHLGGEARRWYSVLSFFPSKTGVFPTLCLIIQLPCSMLGTSLNMLLRRRSAPSPLPARNLHTQR